MKAMKILIAAAAAALMSVSVYAQDYNSVVDKYNQAAELVGARKFAEAIPALEATIAEGLAVGSEAAEIVTNSQKLLPTCYFRVGGAYAQAGNFDEAVANLEMAAEKGELYGELATARNARATIAKVYTAQAAQAYNDKDYAKAAEIFEKGYQADKTNTDLALNLAMSYGEMKDTTNAFRVYREVMALTHSKYKDAVQEAKNKYAYYLTVYAQDAIEAKDYNSAYDLMEQVIAADPANADVNYMLIQTATAQKNWDRIIKFGDAAAEAQTADERKSNVYFSVGAAYQNKENKAKAIEYYRKVTAGPNAAAARTQVTALNK